MSRQSKSVLQHRLLWVIVVITLFIVVYANSLIFTVNEGDHAVTMSYHLFGRNPQIEQVFSAYHGMMDVTLSFLPPDETILRYVSIGLSSISVVTMVLAILALTFSWLDPLTPTQKALIAGMLLLASPEFFYLGLIYSPATIAATFVFLSHLYLRRLVKNQNNSLTLNSNTLLKILFAAILFGFGVAFRWNLVIYGAVIAIDLVVLHIQHLNRDNIGQIIREASFRTTLIAYAGWGVLALVMTFLMIQLSGYSFDEILQQFRSAYIRNTEFNLNMVLSGLAMMTPATALMSLIGLLLMIKRRNPVIIPVLVGFAIASPWLTTGNPKVLISSVPALMLCLVNGFVFLWYQIESRQLRIIARIVIVALLILPWFIGIRVVTEGSAWGPGFEISPYDREPATGTSFDIVIGAGTAFNTAEEQRPIFGHAYVLLFGEWRALQTHISAEYDQVVQLAIEDDLPILILQFTPSYVTNRLVVMDYTTDDPYNQFFEDNDYFMTREFSNAAGDSLRFYYHEIDGDGTIEDLQQIASLAEYADQMVVYGYPRTMQQLYAVAPDTLQRLGVISAILDVDAFAETLEETSD